jgi:hypothetical protein
MTMLKPDDTLLALIDVQGKLAHLMHDRETLFLNLERCIRGAQILQIPILCIEQNPPGLGATIPEISRLLDEYQPMAKTSFSCIKNGAIKKQLLSLKRNQILVAGIETHVCVYQSVNDMLSLDFRVEVIADAVSSRTPENRRYGLQKMQHAGAALTTTEMCLFELVADCEKPEFRQILQLVK